MKKNNILFACLVLGLGTLACSLFSQTDASEEFIISGATQVAPDDILDEVGFFLGGGGGCDCSQKDYSTPQIECKNTEANLMISNTVFSCGWEKNEKITGSVEYPNGKTVKVSVGNASDYDGMAFLPFTPTLQDPVGVYKVTLKGKSGTVTAKVTYNKPEGAHLFLLAPDELLLYGFAPGEKVKLYYFKDQMFVAMQKYKIGSNGRLLVKTSVKLPLPYQGFGDFVAGNFVAVGEQTGEIHLICYDEYGTSNDFIQGSIFRNP